MITSNPSPRAGAPGRSALLLGSVGIAVLLAATCTGYAFYLRGRAVADRDQALANYVACFRGPPLRAGESLHQRLSANQTTPRWPQRCFHYDDELYTAEARVADHDLATVCIERPSFVVLPAERCLEAVSRYDLGDLSPEPAALVPMPQRLLVGSPRSSDRNRSRASRMGASGVAPARLE